MRKLNYKLLTIIFQCYSERDSVWNVNDSSGFPPDELCRKWKQKHDDFEDVHEKCVKKGPHRNLRYSPPPIYFCPQIHYSVAVNLIKYWTCTDVARDLLWVQCVVCICCNNRHVSLFACEHKVIGCVYKLLYRFEEWHSFRMASTYYYITFFHMCMCECTLLCVCFMTRNYSMIYTMIVGENLFL